MHKKDAASGSFFFDCQKVFLFDRGVCGLLQRTVTICAGVHKFREAPGRSFR